MVVLVPPALYQNPEMKWFVCSVIEEAFHTQGLFPNSYPPKKSIGHLSPHWGSIPGNNHKNPFPQIMNLKQHSGSKNCVFGCDEVSQLVHDQLALLTRDSQCPGIGQLRIGRLPLSRAKLGAKDWRVEKIRPELSSKKWPEVRDVFGTIGRSRWCTEFIGEDLWVKDHSSSGLPDHLSLSFNTALRQVIIEEDLQTLDTVIAVQRGD